MVYKSIRDRIQVDVVPAELHPTWGRRRGISGRNAAPDTEQVEAPTNRPSPGAARRSASNSDGAAHLETFDAHRLLHFAGRSQTTLSAACAQCAGSWISPKARIPPRATLLLPLRRAGRAWMRRAAAVVDGDDTPTPCASASSSANGCGIGSVPSVIVSEGAGSSGQRPAAQEAVRKSRCARIAARSERHARADRRGTITSSATPLAAGLRQLQRVVDWFRDGARADAAYGACPTTPWCSTSALPAATACAVAPLARRRADHAGAHHSPRATA